MAKTIDGTRKPILRKRAERDRINVARAAETDGKELKAKLEKFQISLPQLKRENSSPDSNKGGSDE